MCSFFWIVIAIFLDNVMKIVAASLCFVLHIPKMIKLQEYPSNSYLHFPPKSCICIMPLWSGFIVNDDRRQLMSILTLPKCPLKIWNDDIRLSAILWSGTWEWFPRFVSLILWGCLPFWSSRVKEIIQFQADVWSDFLQANLPLFWEVLKPFALNCSTLLPPIFFKIEGNGSSF